MLNSITTIIASAGLTLMAAAGVTGLAGQAQAQDAFIGEIRTFGFNFCPRNWTAANGALLSIASNTALFSLLGTTYGGDGRTTFGLPDLRGRSSIGTGTGPGLTTITWGQIGGRESVNLLTQNLPSHNHPLYAFNGPGDQARPSGDVIAQPSSSTATDIQAFYNQAPDTAMNSQSIGNTGGSEAFNIRDPYLGMTTCINQFGIYPSRS